MTHSWLNLRLQTRRYGGPTVWLYSDFLLGGGVGVVPDSRIVPGSTIYS